MAFYTMIIDFKGGTYALQGHGRDLHTAALNCLENWDITEVLVDISKQVRGDIMHGLIEDQKQGDDFTALTGLDNIWSHAVMLNGATALMNLILTQAKTP